MSEQQYLVVVNDEEQYSIWSQAHELPSGWRATGRAGTRQECLDHIEKEWRDIRPVSARKPQ